MHHAVKTASKGTLTSRNAERSMVGCSAAMATDAAPEQHFDAAAWRRHHQKKPRVIRCPQPTPADALPQGTCQRCGYPGPHQTAAACIEALRDRLSRFE
jgi:hypothetical protein